MGTLTGKRFLIVENEAIIRMSLSDAIEELGGEVVAEAGTFDAGMKKVHEEEFDIAILDVNLSGKMSFDIGWELKRLGLPFLFSTGYRDDENLVDFKVPVLAKPFTKADLQRATARLL